MARRFQKVRRQVNGARYALHVDGDALRVRLAAVDGCVEDHQIEQTLASAIARVEDDGSATWPAAVARALGECLHENGERGIRVTSLAYLGLVADEHEIVVAHAGDLRACLLEQGEAPRCTRDHTTRFEPASSPILKFVGHDDAKLRSFVEEGAILTSCLGQGAVEPPTETRWQVRRPYVLVIASEEHHEHRDASAMGALIHPKALAASWASLWAHVACED